ncbi:hypothetical protein [Pseudarthrobacter sp. NIBRBAC000502771]|uniref:hypothetical protein n=1 Tax=Pseudarthrobacter sp. NIBRBAC000502771 TaxID=2590774 RepID=UPI001131182D|nr:hypothetical protein [Pseudarthrobacter sp. NIBRBAC000502771]QDG62869.1 hypothetical protein NIBR502771_11410 [Pseudarthrobacter sp. NIBRBAC000502771]
MAGDTPSLSTGHMRAGMSPLQRVLVLVLLAAVANLFAAFVLDAATGWDSMYRRLGGVLVFTAMAVAVAAFTRFPFTWNVRSGRLLSLPAVLAVLPVFASVQSVETTVLTAIVIREGTSDPQGLCML